MNVWASPILWLALAMLAMLAMLANLRAPTNVAAAKDQVRRLL
jgi:hypothetical protein